MGAVRRLLDVLRRRMRRPKVYRFPRIPNRDRSDRKRQKRAVDATLGDGEREGEEEGREKLLRMGNV